jgi:poly-gamma-glutamate synthesis protein (capsule biosynthesis protein)
MQKTYRHLIRIGADVVVNHHQHCFSGYEEYSGGLIVYGLGNFYFERNSKRNKQWNYGYMLELNMADKISFHLLPYEQCNGDYHIKPLADVSPFQTEIQELNKTIASPTALLAKYSEFVSGRRPLSPYFPIRLHLVKALYNRGYIPSLLPKSQKLAILNSIRCESHRDVVVNYLSTNN